MPFTHYGFHYGTSQILSSGSTMTGSPIVTTAPTFCDNSNSSQCLPYPKCHSAEVAQNFSRFTNATTNLPPLHQAPPPHVSGFVSPNNASPVLLQPPNPSVYPQPVFASSDHYANKSLEPQTLYAPSLTNQYVMREGLTDPSAWQHPYYPYDPATFAPYGYNNFDLSSSSMMRRKNATRETTGTLKSWLIEHKKNPYPTKGEKIMLAIITKMTLTQVSTWFANARRRLKKENKMTWEPRTRSTDDDDEDFDDDEEGGNCAHSSQMRSDKSDNNDLSNSPINHKQPAEDADSNDAAAKNKLSDNNSSQEIATTMTPHGSKHRLQPQNRVNESPLPSICSLVSNIPTPRDFKAAQAQKESADSKPKTQKTKIWSLADTATNNKTSDQTSDSSASATSNILRRLALPPCSSFPHFSASYPLYSVRPLQTSVPMYDPRTIAGVRSGPPPQMPSSGFNLSPIQLSNFIGNFSSRQTLALKEPAPDPGQRKEQ